MRFQYRLRTLFVAIFVTVFLLGIFLTPVVRINEQTCRRIRPGMTEEEAVAAVGVPPGWYDGVGGIGADSPPYKGYRPFWIGLRGEISVELDESGRVTAATFYPAQWVDWSPPALFWERFTRVQYLGLSLPRRFTASVLLTLLAVVPLCFLLVRPNASNALGNQGLIGPPLGLLASVAMFSDLFFYNSAGMVLMLIGPVVGAAIGVATGTLRILLTRQFPASLPEANG